MCVITVAVVMLIKDFRPYWIIFIMCVFNILDISVILDKQFTSLETFYITYITCGPTMFKMIRSLE